MCIPKLIIVWERSALDLLDKIMCQLWSRVCHKLMLSKNVMFIIDDRYGVSISSTQLCGQFPVEVIRKRKSPLGNTTRHRITLTRLYSCWYVEGTLIQLTWSLDGTVQTNQCVLSIFFGKKAKLTTKYVQISFR